MDWFHETPCESVQNSANAGERTSIPGNATSLRFRPNLALDFDCRKLQDMSSVRNQVTQADADVLLVREARVGWTREGVSRSSHGGGTWEPRHVPCHHVKVADARFSLICYLIKWVSPHHSSLPAPRSHSGHIPFSKRFKVHRVFPEAKEGFPVESSAKPGIIRSAR